MSEEQDAAAQPELLAEGPVLSIKDLIGELTLREWIGKIRTGLRQPKDTGEYKFAVQQLRRLWAPTWGVLLPVLLVIILLLMPETASNSSHEFEVTMIESKEPPKLDDIKPIEPEKPVEQPPIEEVQQIDVPVTDTEFSPMPGAGGPGSGGPGSGGVAGDFSPQPAAFDSVAMVRSPVVMKGIYASRSPGARGSALAGGGGGSSTETAVMRALRWLKKNQETDGSWPKTRPAMTALATLTFLAHGETPSSQEFGGTVERAIRWLVEHQEGDGHFSGRDAHDYTHPICTYALCEAYALTKIPMVRDAAEKALQCVIKGQHASGGFNYNLNQENRDDTSYMGWCAQALKAAKMAGVGSPAEVDAAMRKAINGFKKNYQGDSSSGGFGYITPGKTGLTGVGVLCLQLLGAAKSSEVKGGISLLEGTTFNWNGNGTFNQNYYWYYISQAKFHEGGDIWSRWNKLFSPVLVTKQTVISKGIEDAKGRLADIGFWEMPEALSGHSDGVVMNTCLAALQLEVYYRYLPTFKPPTDVEKEVGFANQNEDIKIKINANQ
jgi:hypothetical protein